MLIINVDPKNDRQIWLDTRRTVITSTKSKKVAPPKRGNKTPAGVYELLAEHVAIAKDGEPEKDRGLRLEDEALLTAQNKLNLDFNLNCGMWLSDDGKRGVSPDACENSDKPTYAGEAKCLDSKNHLQGILNDYEAKQLEGYNPINSLKIGMEDYSYQVVQYFSINEHLEKVYFVLHDDRIALDNIVNYVIVIERKHVDELVKEQTINQQAVINQVNAMIKVLKGIK